MVLLKLRKGTLKTKAGEIISVNCTNFNENEPTFSLSVIDGNIELMSLFY